MEHRHVDFACDHRSVIDVGAHSGQFALFALERFPAARVHCFEPLPGPRERLARVLARSSRVALYPYAIAARSEDRVMHVAGRDDSSSLLPISRRQIEVFPATAPVGTLRVAARRLDELLEPGDLVGPALLKIDVQGAELEVLEGSRSLLERFDEALVECSFVELYEGQPLIDDIVAFMQAGGFRLAGLSSPQHDPSGRVIQADVLFRQRGE